VGAGNSAPRSPPFHVDDISLEFGRRPSVVNVTVDPKQKIRKVDRRNVWPERGGMGKWRISNPKTRSC